MCFDLLCVCLFACLLVCVFFVCSCSVAIAGLYFCALLHNYVCACLRMLFAIAGLNIKLRSAAFCVCIVCFIMLSLQLLACTFVLCCIFCVCIVFFYCLACVPACLLAVLLFSIFAIAGLNFCVLCCILCVCIVFLACLCAYMLVC